MDRYYDEITERLLQAPYWVIDFLPMQVPQESRGQFFAVEQHYLSQEQTGNEVLVTAGGGAYYDENGTEYSWIDGGQMMDYYGNRYNVIW